MENWSLPLGRREVVQGDPPGGFVLWQPLVLRRGDVDLSEQHRDNSAALCVCVCARSLQSCLSLCDTMDCSPPGSSVHGILQARILERVAVPSSRGSPQSRD